MIQEFYFNLQTQMYHGVGYSRNLPEFLSGKGYRSPLIIVDEGVSTNSPYFEEMLHILRKTMPPSAVIKVRSSEEPDYDYLDEVAEQVRSVEYADMVVGIGGGSCLDIAKAAAVLRTNPGKGIEYRGFDKVLQAGMPTVAIPTTAGTGSEVTINAVFTDKGEKKKLGINGRFMNATYAILDAEWTLTCPTSVAVSSGIDALTHTLESFMCRKANTLTRVFGREAFRLLYGALPSLVDDPGNRTRRQELLLGSYLAGVALFNSGSGIAGALSYPIGVHYKVPHGIAGAIFLASVIDYNIENGYQDYAELLDVIEVCPELTPDGKSKRFGFLIRKLAEKLDVPRYLDPWGITKNNVEAVARLMLPLQAAFDQNPIAFSAEIDALEILKKHIR